MEILHFVSSKRLDYLKEKLQEWSKDNYGRIETRIRWWQSTIADLEGIDETHGLNDEKQINRREAEYKLHEAFGDEVSFWSQRAKKMWHEKGDKCSAFFHKVVNFRQARNNAQGLIIDGRFNQRMGKCHDHLINFIANLYTEPEANGPRSDGLTFTTIDERQATRLERDFDEKENKEALDSLASDKTSGPAPHGSISQVLGLYEEGYHGDCERVTSQLLCQLESK